MYPYVSKLILNTLATTVLSTVINIRIDSTEEENQTIEIDSKQALRVYMLGLLSEE
jgi:hypothetical protein